MTTEPTLDDLARDLESDLRYVEPTIWAEAACRRAIAAERERSDLRLELDESARAIMERDGIAKAYDLMRAGMESLATRYDELKHANRMLKADLAEAARLLRATYWKTMFDDSEVDAFLAKHQEVR